MIEVTAPVRICDIGGWTDTWFGGPGRVLNVAVAPGVEVTIRAVPRTSRATVELAVEEFGDRYAITPGDPDRVARHPILEAAVDAFAPPDDLALEITVQSAIPPGSGTGTSAAVAVALIGGLASVRSQSLSPLEVASAAHRLEVDVLGAESGIQDQLSVAFGGINYLEIDPYPDATVRALPMWRELDERLTLVYLGRAHDSSAVHRQVIAESKSRGTGPLARLRDAAAAARDAVLAEDLVGFGRAMIDNTEAQVSLHPALVGWEAERVIDIAAGLGAMGWKVNGAGGDGGSMTVLSASPHDKDRLEEELGPTGFRCLPVCVSAAGLVVRGRL